MSRTVLAAALVLGLSPADAAAQEWREREGGPPAIARSALVLDGDEWRTPTPEEALRRLVEVPSGEARDPAFGILTQWFEPRSRAELDAFAGSLVALILEDDSEFGSIRTRASLTLHLAAHSEKSRPGEGTTPYEGAFDAFRTVYETFRARALVGDGDDPFDVLRRGVTAGEATWRLLRLRSALYDLLVSDPDGRGRDYLVSLIEDGEPPEPGDVGSEWCQASYLLLKGEDWFDEDDPTALPDPDAYRRHCRGQWPRP